MTSYYLLQHLLLALGLALCAIGMPRFFHLAVLPRALLGASLAPQVTGLVVMLLAQADVNAPVIYMLAPGALSAVLLVIAAARLNGYGRRCLSRVRITPVAVVLTLMGAALAMELGLILRDNAQVLNVLPHDFNVYMNAARAFATAPGVGSMPDSYGKLGEVIVVHPHSSIFEAYLAQALMLGGPELSFPPLYFLPRLAQQLTVVYLLLAIAGVAVSMGKRWAVVASLALTLYIPWVYYITESLSRDGFRMAPLFGFIVVLGSLGLNFSSALMKRGLLAGAYAALAVMSHTLGLMLSVIIGASVLACVVVRRRPALATVGAYLIPLVLVASLSVLRYVHNYYETGEFMGYGLQYSIYKGTWLEPLMGKSWVATGQNWLIILALLFDRYDMNFQLATLCVAVLVVLIAHERGRGAYLMLLVALWVPLLLAVSGVLNSAGINLRDALVANSRYPLSFFLLSPPLLVVGVARLGTRLTSRFQLHSAWRQLAVIAVTGLAVLLALQSLRTDHWRRVPSKQKDIYHIRALRQATGCLKPGQHWFVDEDRWNVYFSERPPVFAFTMPARPLLIAPNQAAMETVVLSMNLKFVVFLESSAHWQQSPFYRYLKMHWALVPMAGGYRKHELWVAPEIAECVSGKLGLPSTAMSVRPPNNDWVDGRASVDKVK